VFVKRKTEKQRALANVLAETGSRKDYMFVGRNWKP
jgi:hypothetical protein